MNFPYRTEAFIDGAAEELLRRAFGGPWRERRPVDLDELVYEYLSPQEQLSYNDEAELPSDDGELVLGKTLPIRGQILLNRILKLEPEPGRARFTLAHELGHWVLHRPLILAEAQALDLFAGHGNVGPDYALVGLNKAIFPASCAPSAVRREEWQANRFAASLLVDPVVLREEFEVRFGAPPVARATPAWRYKAASVRALAQLLAKGMIGSHPPLREVFGLSTEAMAIALESRAYVVEQAPFL